MKKMGRGRASGGGQARKRVAAEVVLVCATAAWFHAASELFLIRWYGADIGGADATYLLGVYSVVGALMGGVFFVTTRAMRVTGFSLGHNARHRFLLVGLALVDILIACEKVSDTAAGAEAATIVGFLCAVSFIALVLGWPHARSFQVLFATFGVLSSASIGASAAAIALNEALPAGSDAWVLVGPIGLPAIALGVEAVLAWRREAASTGVDAGRDLLQGAVLVTAAVSVALMVSLSPWPPPIRWHVRVSPPAPVESLPERRRPNVLLLVLDTVRADSLDLFGYERHTMPWLREFALSKADFAQRIMANGAATLASHGSMFTGHFVYSHGAHSPLLADEHPPAYGYPLRSDLPTLAEWLSGLGYQSANISSNYAVLSGYGLQRGFDYLDVQASNASKIRTISWLSSVTLGGYSLTGALQHWLLPAAFSSTRVAFNWWIPHYRTADRITELAVNWLERRADRPFFLFLNYLDAHDPYIPPPPYRFQFGESLPANDWSGFPHGALAELLRGGAPPSRPEFEQARSMYDGELAFLDTQIARLFQYLHKRGLYEDTFILIVGDHGEGFLEHGLLKHNSTTYDTQVAVPLVIKLPVAMQSEPPVLSPSFQHVDFIPTIAAVLGADPPPGVGGCAWGMGRDYAVSEVYVAYRDYPDYRRELCAVQIGRLKYIRSTSGSEELYDLSSDPGETRNLIGAGHESLSRMRQIADLRERSLSHWASSGTREGGDMLDRLRALGYVE